MTAAVSRFYANEAGATSIEYALIAALICVVIVGSITGVGLELSTMFQDVADAYASVQ